MTSNQAPATRRERVAWCWFDFANSAFNTIVVTFVYSAFFAGILVGDQQRGDVLWSRALTVSGLTIAVLSPLLGSFADRTANKKLCLFLFSAVTIVCTAALWWPTPAPGGGASDAVIWTALVLFGLANIGFELAFVFYNAFLPGLADAKSIGRLSGYGWACGYAGGLLCLAVCLTCVGYGGYGPWLPDEDYANVRATSLVAATWFAVFAVPMFLFVKDRKQPMAATAAAVTIGATLRGVGQTIRDLRRCPDLARLLVAHLLYNDALMALIGLSGLYMAGTLGMPTSTIMLTAIWLNVIGGVGALVFGYIDDFMGAKAALVSSLLLLIAGAVLAIAVPTVPAFLVAATLVGLGMGPSQAASRTMLARFIVPQRSAELYGLFSLSGKATVWLGPWLFSLVRAQTDSQRLALTPLIVLFVIGLWILLGIDEERGIADAQNLGTRP